tara:strand:+ start:224 stop:487 length:264 start_codon:yes stop_codon:yes gene_type:complete
VGIKKSKDKDNMDNDIEFKLQDYRVRKTFNNRLPNDTEFDFAGVAEDTVYENFYDRYSVIHGISPRFTQTIRKSTEGSKPRDSRAFM